MKPVFKVIIVLLFAAAIVTAGYYNSQTRTPAGVSDEQVLKVISNNPQAVLEQLAKSTTFGSTIKSFSTVGEEEVQKQISSYIENNPTVLENYIRNNASFVAEAVLNTEEFKEAVQKAAPSDEQAQNDEANAEDEEAKKFLEHWDEMINSDVAPAIGPKDAKVTVVEFFDFACGHCKSLAPIVAQIVKQNPDVRFVFNPLYFISEHSPYAAKVALAAYKKGKFAEVYEGVMTLPTLNEDAINQILVDEGLDVDEIKKMIEEKEIRRGVQEIDALSQVLGINGVPMLIINGYPFYSRSMSDLQKAINSFK